MSINIKAATRRGRYCGCLTGVIGFALLAPGLVHAEQQPFVRMGWNARVQQRFMHAPTFDFSPMAKAEQYRATLKAEHTLTQVLYCKTPRFELEAIWERLPRGRDIQVTVEALDKQDKVLGTVDFVFKKKVPFTGLTLPRQSDYRRAGLRCADFMADTMAGRRAELRSFAVKPGGVHGWPGLFYSAQIRLMATAARHGPSDKRDEYLRHAHVFTDWLIEHSTPTDWAWPNVPPTQEIHGKHELIQPSRVGLLGEAYLDLVAVQPSDKVLSAAMRMADTLKKRQLPEGRWPFRINARTGETVIDYTSDQIEIVVFLERLMKEHGRADLKETIDRAVRWTLDNPATNYRWEGQYDDMAGFEPYQGLEWYDTGFFILYLLRNAEDDESYVPLARELMRYIDDQFIVWAFSPRYITPAALEQYNCYQFVDYSIAHYIKICMGFHRTTGESIWLDKARVMANTLTNLQHPDGWFACQHPTHKGDPDHPGTLGEIQFVADWGPNYLPNCSAYSAEMLIRFNTYLEKVEPACRPDQGGE